MPFHIFQYAGAWTQSAKGFFWPRALRLYVRASGTQGSTTEHSTSE